MDTPRRIIILALILISGGPAGSLSAQQADGSQIAGRYEGIVWSSGSLWPVTTVFSVSGTGDLAGTYVYQERGEVLEGTLSRFRQTGDRTWLLVWREDSGSGTLEATFNEDFTRFEGLWSPLDDGDGAYPWVGERMD